MLYSQKKRTSTLHVTVMTHVLSNRMNAPRENNANTYTTADGPTHQSPEDHQPPEHVFQVE
jgi:hypothetical protein